MPTYDYHCKNCSHQMETFQKITDTPLSECPSCGDATLRRGPGGGIGLSFQGTGFYITDYKNGDKPSRSEETKKPAEQSSTCQKNECGCP